jgi:hypothetical protein
MGTHWFPPATAVEINFAPPASYLPTSCLIPGVNAPLAMALVAYLLQRAFRVWILIISFVFQLGTCGQLVVQLPVLSHINGSQTGFRSISIDLYVQILVF